MAAAPDLGSGDASREGSSPFTRTSPNHFYRQLVRVLIRVLVGYLSGTCSGTIVPILHEVAGIVLEKICIEEVEKVGKTDKNMQKHVGKTD